MELTVYTLTVHDGGVNQGLCAESKMYIDDLRVKGGVILGRGWEVHVFLVSAQRCGCAVAPPGAAFCPGCVCVFLIFCAWTLKSWNEALIVHL